MPPDTTLPASDGAADAPYGPEYYASHCGPVAYTRNDHWLRFFGGVADALIRAYAPGRVFDAGCALGLLVESFWDRGVEAHGRDISAWAISQARADVRPVCEAGSIADPIEGEYDLLTCIEVLEHMPEADALRAIGVMGAVAPRILFSSSPTDFAEPTHCNVRPTLYWLARWAEAGFAPSISHDAGYLAPHAFVLERSDVGRSARDLAAFADRVRHRVALAQLGGQLADLSGRLAEAEAARAAAETERAAAAAALAAAAAEASAARAAREQDDARRAEAEARRALEERRMRAAAAQRAMQARAEAAVMRTRAAEAEAEAAGLRGRLAEAALAASLRQPAPAAEDTRLAAVSAALRQAEIERDIILRSTAWRATWPLRAAARLLPAGLRRGLRGAVAAAWAAATGRLGGRLRRRRAAARDRRLIASSGLFDAAWYVQRYPDVAAAGLPPLHHYAACGAAEGRDPGPLFSARDYDATHPEAAASGQPALLHYLAHGGAGAWAAPVAAPPACEPAGAVQEAPEAPEAPAATEPPEAPETPEAPAPEPPALDRLYAERFVALQALRTYAAPHDVPRVTIVTDSIGVDSLYGGVATACILAALLARRLGGGLRLVTRVAAPDPGRIAAVLALHGIGWDGNLDLVHAPPGEGDDVPVAPGDLFLTTSWWSTWATRRSVPASRIAYLLQEDERGFYPLGDDHLRARETMADPSLLYVVNSELLRTHLQAEGLAPGGIAFEPAFAAAAYYPQADRPDGRRNFFFYARPHNPRNLYWRGLQALGAAIDERILPAGDWNFTFVGNATTDMLLPGGARPRVLHSLPWAEYASLVRRMDLGLSLMDTPHPSYPPLDLAASGAVVVTNRFGIKQSLARYSPNILCVEPTVEGLVEGLRRGVALASDRPAREANFAAQALQRDWAQAMEPVIELLAARFGSHAPVHP